MNGKSFERTTSEGFLATQNQSVEEEQTLWYAENYPDKISLIVGFTSLALSVAGR